MSDKYIPMDIDNNVRVAVKKLREAYWSNDAERYAKQFVEAEDIIISSICHHGYTVVKEGDKEEKRPRGEWIKESLQIDEHHFRSYAKCKVCGCSFKPYSFAVKEFDFCPKCGADMREGDGNDDT